MKYITKIAAVLVTLTLFVVFPGCGAPKEPPLNMSLPRTILAFEDDWIYYYGYDGYLHRIREDGTGKMRISAEKIEGSSFTLFDGAIYYTRRNDSTRIGNVIIKMNTDGTGCVQVVDDNKYSSAVPTLYTSTPFAVDKEKIVYLSAIADEDGYIEKYVLRVIDIGSGEKRDLFSWDYVETWMVSEQGVAYIINDGWVYFTSRSDGLAHGLIRFDTETGKQEKISNKRARSLKATPSGQKLIFSLDDGDYNYDLYAYDTIKKVVTKLSDNDYEYYRDFLADDAYVYYHTGSYDEEKQGLKKPKKVSLDGKIKEEISLDVFYDSGLNTGLFDTREYYADREDSIIYRRDSNGEAEMFCDKKSAMYVLGQLNDWVYFVSKEDVLSFNYSISGKGGSTGSYGKGFSDFIYRVRTDGTGFERFAG